eukprot:7405511-Pyramimonas_sp.AAC.1
MEMCMRNDLAVCATFFPTGPTFYGSKGGTSRIDHLLISAGALPYITNCTCLHGPAKGLHRIKARGHRDHLPLDMEIT